MAAFKEWVFILFLTSFAGTIAGMIAPDNPNMKKYLKFACSVVAAAVMVMPIKGLFADFSRYSTNISDFTENGSAYISEEESREWIVSKTLGVLESGIKSTIYEKFGINAENIYIHIKEDAKNIPDIPPQRKNTVVVEKITVEIKEALGADTKKAVEGYIKEISGVETELIYQTDENTD